MLLNSAAAQLLGQFFLHATADLACGKHLVMLSSGAAQRPYEGESSYCAGKAATDQWVRVVGRVQERRTSGCRVIAIAPGIVDTTMQDQIRATDVHAFPEAPRFRELWRKRGLSTPEEAARAIWSTLDRKLENGAVLHVRNLL